MKKVKSNHNIIFVNCILTYFYFMHFIFRYAILPEHGPCFERMASNLFTKIAICLAVAIALQKYKPMS